METGFAQTEDMKSWLALLELVQENFPGLDMEEYKAGLQNRICENAALTVKEDGTVIGALLFSKKTRELEFLAVHPQYRRMGIAAGLVRYMFSLFPKGTVLSVITYRENDEKGKAARKFYESLGFTPGQTVTVFDYPCQELTISI